MKCVTALLATGVSLLFVAAPATASSSVPYHDSRVAGPLSFCDTHGHPITSGHLMDHPFAAKTVSSYVPPAPYDKQGAAFLLAYQPRQGVDPAEWTGKQLTASSTYTNRQHPMAEGVYGDVTLYQAATTLPPHWDGLLQIRMYFKAPEAPTYVARYSAADIRVTGDVWQVVNPVVQSCNSGTASSLARILDPADVNSPSPKPGGHPLSGTGAPSSSGSPSASSSASPGATPTADSSPSVAAAPTASRSRSGIGWLRLAIVAALVVAAGSALLWRRVRTAR